MNILENYIEEIHSVEPYEEDWTKEFDKKFLKVDVTTNCYGSKQRGEHVWDVEEWERIKEQGYYMG